MTKDFCDLCGKELKQPYNFLTIKTRPTYSDSREERYDLCGVCMCEVRIKFEELSKKRNDR